MLLRLIQNFEVPITYKTRNGQTPDWTLGYDYFGSTKKNNIALNKKNYGKRNVSPY